MHFGKRPHDIHVPKPTIDVQDGAAVRILHSEIRLAVGVLKGDRRHRGKRCKSARRVWVDAQGTVLRRPRLGERWKMGDEDGERVWTRQVGLRHVRVGLREVEVKIQRVKMYVGAWR